MPNPTPGEVAYTAFWTTDLPDVRGAQWAALPPSTQARWEAAAQAVLDHDAFPPFDLRLEEPSDV